MRRFAPRRDRRTTSCPVRHPCRTLLVGAALACAVVLPATALSTSTYPSWELVNPGTDATVTGTVTFGVPGFSPTASMSTVKTPDADDESVVTTNSDEIVTGTPWADVFGPSTGKDYLRVRVFDDGTTATTTYIFDEPVGPGGWGFALGDLDLDVATISAYDAADTPLTGEEIQGQVSVVPFNFELGTDVPNWIVGTRTLTGMDEESSGAAGWFRPSKTVKRLVIAYTALPDGYTPSYRTWFAVLSYAITGTVVHDGTSAPMSGATVTLRDPAGAVVTTATTDASGAFDFGIRYAQAGYTVILDPPSGQTVIGSPSQTVSNVGGDATANFRLASGSSSNTTPAPTPTPGPGSAPTISIPGAQPVAGRTLAVRNRVSGPGTVTVRARRGQAVACSTTRTARKAGAVLMACPLNAATVRILRTRSITLRITSTLTDAQGIRATATRTIRVPRIVPRVPVTG